ncbi:anthranilate/aminodeoxychorismate synthase component II [bacterium]|nr:MAG: anthranilate/aminodeoxychorismate synthase component II [bacterium]
MSRSRPRLLVLDNRDSFTFNVVQALRQAGAATGVVDSRAMDPADFVRLDIDGLVISPGPGRPQQAGYSLQALEYFAPRLPVLGVCLGHQCLAEARGARLVEADRILHGKSSIVQHDGAGLFAGLPPELEAMRYHSLLVHPDSLGPSLECTAWTAQGEVMGLRCKRTGAEGLQFHPESVIGDAGAGLFAAFVQRCAGQPAEMQGTA